MIILFIEGDRLRYKKLEIKVKILYDNLIVNKINEKKFNRIIEKTQAEQKLLQERIEKNKKFFEDDKEENKVYK